MSRVLNTEVSPDANVEAVRGELLSRSIVGLRKYGVTTERKDIDLYAWVVHTQEEMLDAAVYLQAMKSRMVLAERLIKLMWSHNPDLPMGEGTKAEFLDIRAGLDAIC